MKKYVIAFIVIVIAIVSGLYGYFTYKQSDNAILKENAEYEYYYNKEIYGAELATIINKAINNNENNKVEKNNKGKYIENEENSIKIDIKIIDNDTIYDAETIYSGGIDKFVQNYNTVQFKCVNINYHPNTNRIKYLYFEQITQ